MQAVKELLPGLARLVTLYRLGDEVSLLVKLGATGQLAGHDQALCCLAVLLELLEDLACLPIGFCSVVAGSSMFHHTDLGENVLRRFIVFLGSTPKLLSLLKKTAFLLLSDVFEDLGPPCVRVGNRT